MLKTFIKLLKIDFYVIVVIYKFGCIWPHLGVPLYHEGMIDLNRFYK